MAKHRHVWTYGGGVARCKCGRYLQPSGKITKTPTGRKTSLRKGKS